MSKTPISEDFQRLQMLAHKKILSFKEALLYMDCSSSFLYKKTAKREINFTKPNEGKLFFLKSDLDEYMLQNKHLSFPRLEKQVKEFLKSTNHEK